jgi:hypothetical protein
MSFVMVCDHCKRLEHRADIPSLSAPPAEPQDWTNIDLYFRGGPHPHPRLSAMACSPACARALVERYYRGEG